MVNLFYLCGFIAVLLGFVLHLSRRRQRSEEARLPLICRTCVDKNGNLIRFILAQRPVRFPIPIVSRKAPDPSGRGEVAAASTEKPNTALVSLFICMLLLVGCTPSIEYQRGQGFFSEDYVNLQARAAAKAGTKKDLGPFSQSTGACWLYFNDSVDQKIILPTVKAKLKEMGGNVAENILIQENDSTFWLNFLILPILAACGTWNVSGEAFLMPPIPSPSVDARLDSFRPQN
jgi:hypothetical protein